VPAVAAACGSIALSWIGYSSASDKWSPRSRGTTSFIRETTGRDRPKHDYGLNKQMAERLYSDYRSHRKQKKRKSFLDDLFE
jgi:hypothetical protein